MDQYLLLVFVCDICLFCFRVVYSELTEILVLLFTNLVIYFVCCTTVFVLYATVCVGRRWNGKSLKVKELLKASQSNAIHLEEVEELKQTQVTCETKRIKTKVPWSLKNRHESESTGEREFT